MRRCAVVTEQLDDTLLLQAALGTPPSDVEVRWVAAGGWSGADALARSIRVHGEADVAEVVDADSTDRNLVEGRRQWRWLRERCR